MLIGNVLEKTDAVSAWQLCANKLAERDFTLAFYREEGAKRAYNRKCFCEAFAQWQALFREL